MLSAFVLSCTCCERDSHTKKRQESLPALWTIEFVSDESDLAEKDIKEVVLSFQRVPPLSLELKLVVVACDEVHAERLLRYVANLMDAL